MHRYTYIWWGDGYLVYDGDQYIGKDDQVDEVKLMVDAGVAQRIDAADKEEIIDAHWGDNLHELLAALYE